MVEINIQYQGDLHCEAVHGPSGTALSTDAPKDNMGKGESFSPTDLLATALGSCILTVMAIAGKSMEIELKGTKLSVQKAMVSKPIRRVEKLTVQIHIPLQLNEEQKQKLMHAAMTCPVHKSLHPDIQTPVEFTWG